MIREKYSPAAVLGRIEMVLRTLDYGELHWCRRFNGFSKRREVELLFATVSRIGDGVVWYLTMLLLPLFWGREALFVVFEMLLAGAVCLLIYKKIKHGTKRLRPCERHAGIHLRGQPLDKFSFPSGHTLHAVSFTALIGAHYPVLLWLFFPLTVLIAMSRLVLGLHYPSDVIAGAIIGWIVAVLVILI